MNKKWYTERKWETNKTEIRFEKLLKENGFNIVGIKEFMSKTDYLIEKEGVECTFAVYHTDNKPSRGNLCFDSFVNYFDIKCKYENLKKEAAR
jgi:hypothetical protein